MKRLFISFSGGKTSGYMTKRLLDAYTGRCEIVTAFANTGQENEETLDFVNLCDRAWGIGVVWLEACVFHGKHQGNGHRIVNFRSAARNGEPFEETIRKYGIPNKAYPHCTRELKLNPMRSYLRSIGWAPGSYWKAIGIRADEPKRISANAARDKIMYPLVDLWPTDKAGVNDWWDEQPFNLNLPDYRGNCKWCWKKTMSKLVRIAQETPQAFDFPARMEREHGLAGHNTDGTPRAFFREHTSTQTLLKVAAGAPTTFHRFPTDADADAGCSESCEAFV